MKKVQLLNDDYVGHVTHLRHACRGIVMNDGKTSFYVRLVPKG